MNHPFNLIAEEIEEISAMPDIQQMWGAENKEEMIDLFNDGMIYAVKFDFISGSPGYCGELFLLQGDSLGEPISLIRRDNNLIIL